jgi:hypothetical protein
MSGEITDQENIFSPDVNRKFASLCSDLTDSPTDAVAAMGPEHGVERVARRDGGRYRQGE